MDIVKATLVFICSMTSSFAQEYIVTPNDSEHAKIAALSPEQQKIALKLLQGNSLDYLHAEASTIGDVGKLWGTKYRDAPQGRLSTGAGLAYWGLDVTQVVDNQNARAMDGQYWLRGWDTSNWVDGDILNELRGAIVVRREPVKYEAVSGASRTVVCFERVDAQPAIDLAGEILWREKYRIWKDKDGRELIAKYVRSNSKTVTLKDRDKKQLRVEISTLSNDDQAWIEDQ